MIDHYDMESFWLIILQRIDFSSERVLCYSSAWFLWCFFIVFNKENVLRHSLQSNGFSSEWVLWSVLRKVKLENLVEHSLQWYGCNPKLFFGVPSSYLNEKMSWDIACNNKISLPNEFFGIFALVSTESRTCHKTFCRLIRLLSSMCFMVCLIWSRKCFLRHLQGYGLSPEWVHWIWYNNDKTNKMTWPGV